MIQDFYYFVQHRESPSRWISARSISRPGKERLHRLRANRSTARVLSVFEQACNLVTPTGDVISVVLPPIGDGPLNIVVEMETKAKETPHSFSTIAVGAPVMVEGACLHIGNLNIKLNDATVWEPRPDWHRLRSRWAAITSQLPLLRDLAQRLGPADSFLSLLQEPTDDSTSTSFAAGISSTARTATHGLLMRNGEETRLRTSIEMLAGLGCGLTPAGDDLLAGWMIGLWLFHPTPKSPCRVIIETAAPRTTILSAAFMRASARGECSVAWHRLLTALSEPGSLKAELVQRILAHGATSGADGLAGFLLSASRCAVATA